MERRQQTYHIAPLKVIFKMPSNAQHLGRLCLKDNFNTITGVSLKALFKLLDP